MVGNISTHNIKPHQKCNNKKSWYNSLPWKVTRSDNFFDQGNDSTCCEATTSRQRTRSNYLLWETTISA